MHTIVAMNHNQENQMIVNDAVYTKTDRVNGDRIVSFEIEYTENNKPLFENIDKRWLFRIVEGTNQQDFVVQNIYEKSESNSLYLIVDVLDERYDILKREMVYEEHNGSKTRDEWFRWVMKGSKFKLDIRAGKQSALRIESFGYDSKLSLLFQLLDKFSLEFFFEEHTLVIVDKIGTDKSDYVAYGLNLSESIRSREMSGFGTYGEIFGAWKDDDDHSKGRYHEVYEHPLAKVYGKIPIKPLVDERFKIKENMIDALKKSVEASISISLEVSLDELYFEKMGSKVYAGDTIVVIDPRLDIKSQIRVCESNVVRNFMGEYISTTYTLGDYDEQYKSQTNTLDNQQTIDLQGKINDKVNDNITTIIQQASGYGSIYRSKVEPVSPNLKHGDLWYQPYWNSELQREEVKMYQYVKEGAIGRWELIGDSAGSDEIKNEIDKLEKEVADQKESIDTALENAENSLTIAEKSRKDAFDSKEIAEQAQKDINEAQESIIEVKDSADKALEEATNAKAGLITINGKVEQQGLTINKLDNELQVQSAKVEGNSTSVASLKLESDRIATEVVKTNEKVDGIEIGGRNLFRGTGDYSGFIFASDTGNRTGYLLNEEVLKIEPKFDGNFYWQNFFADNISFEKGKEYVFSIWLKASEESTVGLYWYPSEKYSNWKADVGTEWEKYVFKYTQTGDTIENPQRMTRRIAGLHNIKAGLTYYVKFLKLEQANYDTDWSLAIEDQANQSEVTKLSTKIDQTAESVKIKADKSEVDSINETVKENKAQIEVHNQQIQLKASQSEVDKINDTVKLHESEIKLNSEQIKLQTSKIDSNTTEIANIKVESDKISSTVAKVEDDLNQIGLPNLYIGSDISYKAKDLINHNASLIEGRGIREIDGDINNYKNKEITLSVDIEVKNGRYRVINGVPSKNDSRAGFECLFNHVDGSKTYAGVWLDVEDGTNFKGRLKKTVTVRNSDIESFYAGGLYVQCNGDLVHISKPKISFGDDVWKLSEGDSATVSEMSNVTQTVQGLQVSVQNKAEQSEVTIMSNQLNSTIKRVDTVENLWTTQGTQITQLNNAIKLKVDKTEHDALTGKVNKNTSDITMLNDQIDLSVKKGDTIGQINVEAGKVLIRANDNVLMITPNTTYIQNATIKTAMIEDASITNAKIQDASISNAKIISLDANKIVANKLNAITTNTGDLNVTGWLDIKTENNGIRGEFDFADDPVVQYARWHEGNFRLSHRHLFFGSKQWLLDNEGNKRYWHGKGESFYGANYFKSRWYGDINNHDNLTGRIDIRDDFIQVADVFGDKAGSKMTPKGFDGDQISVNKIVTRRNSKNIYFNREFGWPYPADFRIGHDGKSPIVQSMAIYYRTYNWTGGNVTITDSGAIGRATSASKYKLNIDTIPNTLDYAKQLLNVKPKKWFDKESMNIYNLNIEKGMNLEDYYIGEIYGLIAEDVEEAGLSKYCQYNSKTGEIEGISYDKLTTLLIPLVKDLYERIEVLENNCN